MHPEPSTGLGQLTWICDGEKKTSNVFFPHPYHIVCGGRPQPSGEEANEKKSNVGQFWQMVCVSGYGSGAVGGRRHPMMVDATTELPVNSSKMELGLLKKAVHSKTCK